MSSHYSITADGGAKGNGLADSHGFGSYQLSTRSGQQQTVRLDFGLGVTNNGAEYRALIAALEDLLGRIHRAGRSPERFSVSVQTDSQPVVGHLVHGWQIKATHLRPLVDKARSLLAQFGDVTLTRVPRETVVAILGH